MPGVTGFWHLSPDVLLLCGIPAGGGPRSITMNMTTYAGLIGQQLVFQVHDGSDYLSRPVLGVVGP
jgi:hypothetical protein